MSNPYPERFRQLLDQTTGPVLDCGSGGRTHPRVTSLEYCWHPAITVQAHGHALPFRTGTFSLVLSQAVIEHVTDPQGYVDEMIRVLAPGGWLYIEGAFLQPVHQAPAHFFNVTGFGLAHLCRNLEIVEQGAFGRMVDWWRWVGSEAGADEHLTDTERRNVDTAMRRLDQAMTPERLWNVASAVSLLGRKR